VATNRLALVLQNLRRSVLLRDSAEQTDHQLLEAFLRQRDGQALEALVVRHAPMVWGVCRRTLAHHDAEDAFQATFLVLVRRAASIRSPELLPNWLACQTARKARQRAAERSAREKQVRVLPEPQTAGPCESDLWAVLDEEISRLPEKYRVAVVLCDVEGRTRTDAARQLGLPQGTVASRLTRGRALLAKRLLRRGLGVSATTLAAGLGKASGAVPADLLTRMIQAVTLPATGEAVAAGLISAEVGPLTEGVLRTLAVSKLKTALLVLVFVGLVPSGGLLAHHILAGRDAPSASADDVKHLSDQPRLDNGAELRAADPPCAPLDESSVAAALEKIGAGIRRDDQLPGNPVIDINLTQTQVTDADLKDLKVFKNLTGLHLGVTRVTNEGLKYLKELQALQGLNLPLTQVSDEGLKDVTDLQSLRLLNLAGTRVTDAGLEHLKALTSLQLLDLTSTPVTEKGVKTLKEFKTLRRLLLTRTQVTDAGAQELREALPGCQIDR
jgi:RNA polymerase sigma factor (sigma-70 family)